MARRMMPQQPVRGRAQRGKVLLYTLLIGVLLIAVALPTLIVVFVGMLPGMVAFFWDRTDQKYAFFCVGGLNFAGLFSYLMDLWGGDHTIPGAINIISDVFAMAITYGAAACGWVVFIVVPPVITSFMTVLTERRLSALRNNQQRIVEEWGEEVAMAVRAPEAGSTAIGTMGPPTPGGETAPPTPGNGAGPGTEAPTAPAEGANGAAAPAVPS